jgi:hypothetical protein
MLEKQADNSKKLPPELEHVFTGAPKLDSMLGGVRNLEEWYSTTFQRRISELAELLSTEIRGELRSQFDSELKTHTESLRSSWETETESLKKEIERLKKRAHSFSVNDALEEIARVENDIRKIEAELERSFTVDTVPLSELLKLRTTQTDLKAYLRGLKYSIGKLASESAR